MGMATDAAEVQDVLPVDYRMETRDVFITVAHYLLKDMPLEAVALNITKSPPALGLPSFVPYWDVNSPELESPQDAKPPRGSDYPRFSKEVGRSAAPPPKRHATSE